MSGHSKWSNIKHKKAASDFKKSTIFTKLAKKIQIAVKMRGTGDPEFNPTLRTILDEARSVNMPNENIKRAIEKGAGIGEDSAIMEMVYEAYGPGGIGIMITTTTDNHNRTVGEIKSILDKKGGSLGGPGSVSYLKNLDPIPMIELFGDDMKKARLLLSALDDHEDVTDVWTNLGDNNTDE